MKLKFTSPSGIIVSTAKLPFTKVYETMIFNEYGDAIFERRYTNIEDAKKWHKYYTEANSK
jgi:hypothetical protein